VDLLKRKELLLTQVKKSLQHKCLSLFRMSTWVLIWKNKPLMFNIDYFLCTPCYRVETNSQRVMISTDAICRCKFNFHMSDTTEVLISLKWIYMKYSIALKHIDNCILLLQKHIYLVLICTVYSFVTNQH